MLKRRIRTLAVTGITIVAAALVGSLGVAAVPASAATQRPAPAATPRLAEVPAAKGAILCSGDLCIQNDGIVDDEVVLVSLWAYDSDFYGHMELSQAGNGYINYPADNDQWWYAGKNSVQLGLSAYCTGPYVGTAWARSGTGYQDMGRVSFGLSVCTCCGE